MDKNIERDFLIESLKLSINGIKGDCHKNSKLIYEALKKLGYEVKLVHGRYVNLPKVINHSWIEYQDKILETDCRQLRQSGDIMPDDAVAVLDKSEFGHRYCGGN